MASAAEERRNALLTLWGYDPRGHIPRWLMDRAKEAVHQFDETGVVPPRPAPTSDQILAVMLYDHRLVLKHGRALCSCGDMQFDGDYETHLVTKIREAGWAPERFNF